MGKAGYSKIGDIAPTEKIKEEIEVQNYVFYYEKEDLVNAKLEYYFDKVMHVEYVDGERKEESFSPLINFSISADDKNKKTFTFDFIINMDVDMLNELSDKPNVINEYVIDGEVFFDNPYDDKKLPLSIYCSFGDSMYHDNTCFWASKLENNKFVFKISCPEASLFIWFIVKFK